MRAPRPLRRRRSARGGIARLLLGLAGLCGLCSAALATEYIAFGDSITFGIGDETVPSEPRTPGGYPMRLQNLYAVAGTPIEMNNAGEPGENTAEGLTRIDKVLNQSGSPGDVLLLMEGTNDIANHIGIETTRFNLGEMSRKAEARGLSVVQATLIPRRPDARFDPQNILNVEIVEHIRDQAGRKNRVLVDNFEIFSGLSNLFEKYYYHYYPNSDDPVGHPNAAGYDVMAHAFFDALHEIDTVAPVPGVTSPKFGDEHVPASSPITVDMWDFGTGIDLAHTRLLVNGADTGVTASGDTRHAQLTYTPATPLQGQVRVSVQSNDLNIPTPNSKQREVIRYTTTSSTQTLAGDLDHDGRVDGSDLVVLARSFGAQQGDVFYDSVADLNEDGLVDGVDLAELATNFGKSIS